MEKFDDSAKGDAYTVQSNALAAWFLGPRAENGTLFNDLVKNSFELHEENRRKFHPTDPEYVSNKHTASDAYKAEVQQLRDRLTEMNDELQQSTPIFSPRFQGHMNWDITMPSFLGYISGMLWNPNNVDVTASPVTTPYEIIVGDQICDMIGFDRSNPDYQPWGHITCGGSIANIEALWSSRNLKFYALSLQDAVKVEVDLEKAKDYPVQVPAKTEPDAACTEPFISCKLIDCSTWQLLNLDVDEACKMAEGVATMAGITIDKLSELVHHYTYTSRGILSFLGGHNINPPRAFCPATCHYSWPKAATVLGLGENNLILIEVDRNARQRIDNLREQLDICVKNSYPVISVTAVMGSTEESAMDPLIEILNIRDEYRLKGLNFCVLADAAWGAYMMTILREPEENAIEEQQSKKLGKLKKHKKSKKRGKSGGRGLTKWSVAPVTPLSDYVKENMMALRRADTVTSDPHKTGYCPYPAGGLSYRNGTMKDFVLLAAPEVFHSSEDLSVGVNGLEGSKPGAAASGVLLSHRVIGLDKYGYGRILGQCLFGSKMFYCMWTHLAKETDPFVFEMYKPCTPEEKEKMKELIIGKTNLEISNNPEAMTLLGQVGPDALINKFGMNVKIDGELNNDVDVSTNFSKKVGQILSVNVDKNNNRVSMVMFQSMMERKTFGPALEEFEKSLGLTVNNDHSFGCMVNTIMNPWQTSTAYVSALGDIYLDACYNAYGLMYEPAACHKFVVCDATTYSKEYGWHFFATLCAKFGPINGSESYNAVVKFSAINATHEVERKLRENKLGEGQLFVVNSDPLKLYELLEENGRKDEGVQFGMYTGTGAACDLVTLKVVDVVRMDHFKPANDPDVVYPEKQTYLLFGESEEMFLSHIITKSPDFQQVVKIKYMPDMSGEEDEELLWYGTKVTFPNLVVDKANPTKNPFTREDCIYKITFKGRQQEPREMSVTLENNVGWFDTSFLNISPTA